MIDNRQNVRFAIRVHQAGEGGTRHSELHFRLDQSSPADTMMEASLSPQAFLPGEGDEGNKRLLGVHHEDRGCSSASAFVPAGVAKRRRRGGECDPQSGETTATTIDCRWQEQCAQQLENSVRLALLFDVGLIVSIIAIFYSR